MMIHNSSHLLLIVLIVVLLCSWIAQADLGFYENSIASYEPLANLNLNQTFIARNSLTVSSNPFAGTNNTVYVTFIGDFASSGPHALNGLQDPSVTYDISVPLDRLIGNLHSVWVENPDYDSLLLSAWKIRLRENVYELAVQETWLQTFDPVLFAETGDGFSPFADITLPSSSTLLLSVAKSYFFYSEVGLYTAN